MRRSISASSPSIGPQGKFGSSTSISSTPKTTNASTITTAKSTENGIGYSNIPTSSNNRWINSRNHLVGNNCLRKDKDIAAAATGRMRRRKADEFITVLSINKRDEPIPKKGAQNIFNGRKVGPIKRNNSLLREDANANGDGFNQASTAAKIEEKKLTIVGCGKKFEETPHLTSTQEVTSVNSHTLVSAHNNINNNNNNKKSGFVTVLQIGCENSPNPRLEPKPRPSATNFDRGRHRQLDHRDSRVSTSLPPATGTVLVRVRSYSEEKPSVRQPKPVRKHSIVIGLSESQQANAKQANLRRSVSSLSDSKTSLNTSTLPKGSSLGEIYRKSSPNKSPRSRTDPHQHHNQHNKEPIASADFVSSVEEDLIIYRLPGDKLGLGLRFDGGSKASECVRRLFVQSCAHDSPAAKTKCTWGFLSEGDEVVSISGKIVRRMTRVDCVKALRESPVCVKMRIRHYFSQLALHPTVSYDLESKDTNPKNYDPILDQETLARRSQTLPNLFKIRSSKSGGENLQHQNEKSNLSKPSKPARTQVSEGSQTMKTSPQSERLTPIGRIFRNPSRSQPPLRSSSVPAIGPPKEFGNNDGLPKPRMDPIKKSFHGQPRLSPNISSPSPTTSVRTTVATKALIERSRSRAAQMDNQRPTTLPRRKSIAGVMNSTSPGLFVKAHEQKKLQQASQSYTNGQAQFKSYADDQWNEEFVDEDEPLDQHSDTPFKLDFKNSQDKEDYHYKNSTQTLPRFYHNPAKKSSFLSTRSQSVGELSHHQSLEEKGRVQLVVSSDSFVSCTLPRPPKPVRSVLTVQEKLSQDIPSLPPQAEVYINLLEDETSEDEFQESFEESSLENDSRGQEEHSDVETESTISTIHSRHITPSQSKHTTPRSSFAKADRTTGNFDIAKLLDPFEKLEQEFKWEEVKPLRPPSAFGSFSNEIERKVEAKQTKGKSESFIEENRLDLIKSFSHKSQMSKTIRRFSVDSRIPTFESKNLQDLDSIIPPPTFSRLPPDGHEFPPEYRDPSKLASENSHRNSAILNRTSSVGSMRSFELIETFQKQKNVHQQQQQNTSKPIISESGSGVKAKIALFSGELNQSGQASASHSPVFQGRSASVNHIQTNVDKLVSQNETNFTQANSGKASVTKCDSNNKVKTTPIEPSEAETSRETKADVKEGANSKQICPTSSPKVLEKIESKSPMQGRSQSLLEIRTQEFEQLIQEKMDAVKVPEIKQGPSSGESNEMRNIQSSLAQKRKNNFAKLKSLVIDENIETAISSFTPLRWSSVGSDEAKYSPTFARKPYAVYTSRSESKLISQNIENNNRTCQDECSTNQKNESIRQFGVRSQESRLDTDSDNDSAVSSGKSSLSQGSSSPIQVPVPVARHSRDVLNSGSPRQSLRISDPGFSSPEEVDGSESEVPVSKSPPRDENLQFDKTLTRKKNLIISLSSDSLISSTTSSVISNKPSLIPVSPNKIMPKDKDDSKSLPSPSLNTKDKSQDKSQIVHVSPNENKSVEHSFKIPNVPKAVKSTSPNESENPNQKSLLAKDDDQSPSRTVNKRERNHPILFRPLSMVETSRGDVGNIKDDFALSNPSSRKGSRSNMLESSGSIDNTRSPVPHARSESYLNQQSISISDIKRAFEKSDQPLTRNLFEGLPTHGFLHHRMSSIDSTTSEDSTLLALHSRYDSVSSLFSGHTNIKDRYGSITSLASSTSIISPQELQGLIDEANQSLEESGTPSHEIMVIVLHRELISRSIGITLAGGADYENKEITVHKVIPGTLADCDGRIQRGDRVLSINGKSTKGMTHEEAWSILKAPKAEVVLVLSRNRSVTPAADFCYDKDYSAFTFVNATRPPKILEKPNETKSELSELQAMDVPRGPPFTVVLSKRGTGMGFSLEGGKDSPVGDRPLTIKKIFTGGVADKSGMLRIGDEILSVNNTDCSRMTRLEAWNFMKKIPDGFISLTIRQEIVLQQ